MTRAPAATWIAPQRYISSLTEAASCFYENVFSRLLLRRACPVKARRRRTKLDRNLMRSRVSKLSQMAVLCAAFAVGVSQKAAALTNVILSDPARPEPAHWMGTLTNDAGWTRYKEKFISADGRIIDTGNGGVSHSEGQGSGMLLAVAANDRATFDKIWAWTRANLAIRDDHLFAWRFDPNSNPRVSDINSASDGDLLIAWALLEAGEAWNERTYKLASRRIAMDIGRELIVKQNGRLILLPGPEGFSAQERFDGPVVNLSYWVFPAFGRLKTVAAEYDWDALAASGLRLLDEARFGPESLPSDWISLRNGITPALDLPSGFGYNAMRIPLYLALSGIGDRGYYRPFATVWREGPAVLTSVVATHRPDRLKEPGYRTLAALTRCTTNGGGGDAPEFTPSPYDAAQDYYPATLQLLARIALKTQWSSCSTARIAQ